MNDEDRQTLKRMCLTAFITLLAIAGCLAILATHSGCEPFTQAARATLTARKAGDQIDKAIADVARAKTKECLGKCPSKSKCFGECVANTRAHLERWRIYARPALSAAIAASYRAIQLAKLAKQKPKDIWPIVIRSICLAISVAKQLQHLFPDSVKRMLSNTLIIGEKFACPDTPQ